MATDCLRYIGGGCERVLIGERVLIQQQQLAFAFVDGRPRSATTKVVDDRRGVNKDGSARDGGIQSPRERHDPPDT